MRKMTNSPLRNIANSAVAVFFAVFLFFTALHEASGSHHDTHSRDHCAICIAGQSQAILRAPVSSVPAAPKLLVAAKPSRIYSFHYTSEIFLTDASPQGPPYSA